MIPFFFFFFMFPSHVCNRKTLKCSFYPFSIHFFVLRGKEVLPQKVYQSNGHDSRRGRKLLFLSPLFPFLSVSLISVMFIVIVIIFSLLFVSKKRWINVSTTTTKKSFSSYPWIQIMKFIVGVPYQDPDADKRLIYMSISYIYTSDNDSSRPDHQTYRVIWSWTWSARQMVPTIRKL